jgi:hypothetical protein
VSLWKALTTEFAEEHSAAKLQSKNKISTADYTDVADLHDTDKEILLFCYPLKAGLNQRN